MDQVADRLYELPLEEFTAARNDAAKKLRQEGDRDAAEEIAALRKPSAPAWVANQLSRRRPRELKALLDAGRRLREAHKKALGGGKRDALQKAAERERQAVSTLVEAGGDIAREAEMKAGPALLDKVRATLHAAATDEEARRELQAGRLVREREAVGMGLVGAAPAPASREPPRGDATRARKRVTAARRDDQAEERRLRKAELAVAAAQERAEAALADLRQAEEREREARERSQRAAEEREAAERELDSDG